MNPDSTHGIIIRTYEADAERLGFCLASIKRYCEGFSDVVVVCQEKAAGVIGPVVAAAGIGRMAFCPAYENDYLGQQITKLRATDYLTTDYIFHVDSDCVFFARFTPDAYFVDGRPVMYFKDYDWFYRQRQLNPWQFITSRLLQRQVDYEFMAMLPLIYPRQMYLNLEAWFVAANGFAYEGIEERLTVPNQFSEFNLMGAFSYYHGGGFYHTFLDWGDNHIERYMKQYLVDDWNDRAISEGEYAEIQRAIGVEP